MAIFKRICFTNYCHFFLLLSEQNCLETFLTLTSFIANLLFFLDSVSPTAWVVLLFLVLVYLVLGMFLDSIGILVLTLPFTIPIAETLGWNLIWFGVLVVKLLEIGLITPPVGF